MADTETISRFVIDIVMELSVERIEQLDDLLK